MRWTHTVVALSALSLSVSASGAGQLPRQWQTLNVDDIDPSPLQFPRVLTDTYGGDVCKVLDWGSGAVKCETSLSGRNTKGLWKHYTIRMGWFERIPECNHRGFVYSCSGKDPKRGSHGTGYAMQTGWQIFSKSGRAAYAHVELLASAPFNEAKMITAVNDLLRKVEFYASPCECGGRQIGPIQAKVIPPGSGSVEPDYPKPTPEPERHRNDKPPPVGTEVFGQDAARPGGSRPAEARPMGSSRELRAQRVFEANNRAWDLAHQQKYCEAVEVLEPHRGDPAVDQSYKLLKPSCEWSRE